MTLRRHPHLIEINAAVLLRRLADRYRRPLTLLTIPDEEWRALARPGFDLVWLMGVWQRSPAARQQALLNGSLRRAFARWVPGWTPADVTGSPYAIHGYELDPRLGAHGDLAALRAKLNRLGLRLIVDFVPNHLAVDHSWTRSHPEWFVQGGERDTLTHPDWFFPLGGRYLAHGRDPYFPPWHDTVQVNFFSDGMRRALIDELVRIAGLADGVRVDMAMLGLNDVFERTWGTLVRDERPRTEFWAEAISAVRSAHPDFLLLGEVYWGMEGRLQALGFDFTYDKTLFDRLRGNAGDVRGHLQADAAYRQRCAHFTENHDEERSVVTLGTERALAAGIVMSTLPGLRFYYDGQLEGKRVHLPVQIAREPEEPADPTVKAFYERLLGIVAAAPYHDGDWQLLPLCRAADGNETFNDLLAWLWRYFREWKLVVVNYSDHPAQGWLGLPALPAPARQVRFQDELNDALYVRDAEELAAKGLFVDLGPYRAHMLGAVID